MTDYQIFDAGDVVLQSGLTYRNAKLAYKTYGTLDAAKSNVIVYPTSYGAQHPDTEWLIAAGKALDPTKYFIVIPNLFGNGLSSSPSNTPPPFDRGRYPHFTATDNVRVQQRLLAETFGIERVALVYGFSMGAQQAFHWGALFPDRVARIAAICGSARTSRHNFVFLEGVKAALQIHTIPGRNAAWLVIDARDVAALHVALLEPGRGPRRYMVGGHRVPVADLANMLGQAAETPMVAVPVPDTVLRVAGTVLDLVGPYLPFDNPLTSAGMQYYTQMPESDDSPSEQELGITYRDPRTTIADTVAAFRG